MGVTSTLATSRRGYLSQEELAQFANIEIVIEAEADDQISQAEELVDSYVGYQEKFLNDAVLGMVSASSSDTFTLESSQQNQYDINYFTLCEVEIVGGTGEGQRRKITASTKAGVLTVDTAWTTSLDTTSFYRIYQLGKFPRKQDVEAYTRISTNDIVYYKQIPEVIKRAVASQVQFVIEMGEDYFSGNKAEMSGESIGDYSYTKKTSSISGALISPKAKTLLRTILNRTAKLI